MPFAQKGAWCTCLVVFIVNASGDSIPIAEWLKSVNPDLVKYADQFAEYGFTDSALLAASDLADIESDLKELKVKAPHRRLILKGLKACAAPESGGGGEWDPSHDPILDHGRDRCNIERVPEADMTYKRFNADYWWKHPVIILRDDPNKKAVAATTKEALLRERGNRKIGITSLESYAFRGEKQTTVRDLLLNTFEQPTDASGEFASNKSALAADIRFSFKNDLGIGGLYREMPLVKQLLNKKRVTGQYQLAMSPGKDVGLGFHCHSDAFAETLHGTRRWFLANGNSTPPGGFNPRRTSASWIHETYSTLGDDAAAREGLYECILRPSELLYVPSGWFHSTVGLGQAVGLSRFTIGAEEEPYAYMRNLYSAANACTHGWYQPADIGPCKVRAGSKCTR
jgi:hypothetical protein